MIPLNFTEEETLEKTKANELNFHNARISKLLREQQFFQTQGNDYMVDKLQEMIEREIERARGHLKLP